MPDGFSCEKRSSCEYCHEIIVAAGWKTCWNSLTQTQEWWLVGEFPLLKMTFTHPKVRTIKLSVSGQVGFARRGSQPGGVINSWERIPILWHFLERQYMKRLGSKRRTAPVRVMDEATPFVNMKVGCGTKPGSPIIFILKMREWRMKTKNITFPPY